MRFDSVTPEGSQKRETFDKLGVTVSDTVVVRVDSVTHHRREGRQCQTPLRSWPKVSHLVPVSVVKGPCPPHGASCPGQRVTGIFGLVWGPALGIAVHGKGCSESSTSCGAGSWGFLSTLNYYKTSNSCWAGRRGFLSTAKFVRNLRHHVGRDAGYSFPR